MDFCFECFTVETFLLKTLLHNLVVATYVYNSPTTVPPILLEGTPLVNVSKQKCLGITINSNLSWAYHVANVCKKMAYYLF